MYLIVAGSEGKPRVSASVSNSIVLNIRVASASKVSSNSIVCVVVVRTVGGVVDFFGPLVGKISLHVCTRCERNFFCEINGLI